MEETLISFDTAKLAKEKGFRIKVLNYFNIKNEKIKEKHFDIEKVNFNGTNHYESLDGEFISRPTQSLIQKWLREKHNLIVWIYPSKDNDFFQFEINHKIVFSNQCKTYEEALESGLIKSLKLI